MLVPIDDREIKEFTLSKAGGLENDELKKFVKQHFAEEEVNKVMILFALQAVFVPVRVADLAIPDWPQRTRLPGSHMPT